jgi:NAD(P)-dependent dehydrogenase (short-subunit alcohol dehydrogenase family)
VTGASRGVGASVAEAFAAERRPVGIFSRDAAALEHVAERLRALGSPKVVVCPGDAGSEADCERAVARFFAELGDISLLVNNAATNVPGGYDEITREQFDHVLAVNLGAVFTFCAGLVPAMCARGDGLVANIGSSSGLSGWDSGTAYNTSKWGLIGYTHCLYDSVREHGVRAISIQAGPQDTTWGEEWGQPYDPDYKRQFNLDPSAIAEFLVFLEARSDLMVQAPVIFKKGWRFPRLGPSPMKDLPR